MGGFALARRACDTTFCPRGVPPCETTMRHYQLMSQGSPQAYESVEEQAYTQLSPSPSVVRQCGLSPNKFHVNQGELSVSQSTNDTPAPDTSTCKAADVAVKVFAVLPNDVRLLVEATSFKHLCTAILNYPGHPVSDAFRHIRLTGSSPVRQPQWGWVATGPTFL